MLDGQAGTTVTPSMCLRLAVTILVFAGLSLVTRADPQTGPRPTFPGSSERGLSPDPNAPRPIDASDSVFLEDLTWMELRDAIRSGKTTAIIPIGGIEQSGPYLVLGKHSYVIRATTDAIARKLGDAIVAPTISLIPEGGVDPPTGFMRYPGAISIQPETFKHLLADEATSLKVHGFKHIVVISDHGGNIGLIRDAVGELSRQWMPAHITIHFIPEYYDYPELAAWLEQQGIHQVDEGLHDDFVISSIVMTVDPNALRTRQRAANGTLSINGVSLSPVERTVQLGRRAIDRRANVTADAIRKAIATSSVP